MRRLAPISLAVDDALSCTNEEPAEANGLAAEVGAENKRQPKSFQYSDLVADWQ